MYVVGDWVEENIGNMSFCDCEKDEGEKNAIFVYNKSDTLDVRGLRGCFQGGRYSKASSLAMNTMDSTTSQGWTCCGMYATGGLDVRAFPSTDIGIACIALSTAQGS